jgi:hypothetical protein
LTAIAQLSKRFLIVTEQVCGLALSFLRCHSRRTSLCAGTLLKPPELHEEIWKAEVSYWSMEEVKEDKKKRFKTIKRMKKKKSPSSSKDKETLEAMLAPPSLRRWEDTDLVPHTNEEKQRFHTSPRFYHTDHVCLTPNTHHTMMLISTGWSQTTSWARCEGNLRR